MPGRLDQRKSLQQMQKLLDKVQQGLHEHFNREETSLMAGFEKFGNERFASALYTLLNHHEGLRQRFVKSQEQVAQLASGGMTIQLWEANAHDMRAYLTETLRELELHAKAEQELLLSLRRQLVKELEKKRKDKNSG